VRRVKLRSLCLEIAADERSRTVVTAQCGGPDRSADDAAGIYRLGARKVRYVGLGIPNPLDVAVAAGRVERQRGASGTGLLCRLRFRGVGAGTTPVLVGDARVWGVRGEALTVQNGRTRVVVR